MSRIDDLIAEHCPNGVIFRPLGEVLRNFDSQRRPVTRSKREPGPYPYYGANGIQDYVSDYIFDGVFLLVGEDGSVVNDDGSPVLNWAEGKIWVNNHAHILNSRSADFELRFAFYYLSKINVRPFVTGGTQLKLNQGNLNKIPLPCPPLEVQREIVRILDTFSELEAELQAELEARRQQYEYYRTSLFAGCNTIEKVSLGDIATIGTGSHDTKDATPDGDYIFYARGREPLRLNSYDFDENAIITAGDGVGVGKVFHFASGKYALHQRAYRVVPNEGVDARYLYHHLVEDFPRYLERTSVHASVTSLRRPMFLKYPVALPPLKTQREISQILDNFDILVSDLAIGLPAELKARRKQYEYYRDKLLTFEELPESASHGDSSLRSE